jgi:hypothetical protein
VVEKGEQVVIPSIGMYTVSDINGYNVLLINFNSKDKIKMNIQDVEDIKMIDQIQMEGF